MIGKKLLEHKKNVMHRDQGNKIIKKNFDERRDKNILNNYLL